MSARPSHAKNIRTRLDEKDDWLLGSLMLGTAPGDMPNFSELRALANRANAVRIFRDGQRRRRAMQIVLAELPGFTDERSSNKPDSLRQSSMSIVLCAEDDLRTLRQMFSVVSKTNRIERLLAACHHLRTRERGSLEAAGRVRPQSLDKTGRQTRTAGGRGTTH